MDLRLKHGQTQYPPEDGMKAEYVPGENYGAGVVYAGIVVLEFLNRDLRQNAQVVSKVPDWPHEA